MWPCLSVYSAGLPGARSAGALPRDFFPLTCRTCVDYTNMLADITIGYKGGQGEQRLVAPYGVTSQNDKRPADP